MLVVELCEAAESNTVGLVPRKFRTKGEDEEVPILEIVGSCWRLIDPVATLPKAVAGAISVSNSNWTVKVNFAIFLFCSIPDLSQSHYQTFRFFCRSNQHVRCQRTIQKKEDDVPWFWFYRNEIDGLLSIMHTFTLNSLWNYVLLHNQSWKLTRWKSFSWMDRDETWKAQGRSPTRLTHFLKSMCEQRDHFDPVPTSATHRCSTTYTNLCRHSTNNSWLISFTNFTTHTYYNTTKYAPNR